jgi:hypothetical protein
MGAQASVKLDTSRLKQIEGQLDPRAREVIGVAAFEIESETKQSIANYPAVDTGAYLGSTYTSCGWGRQPSGTTSYAKGRSEAQSLKDGKPLPEEKPGDKLACTVGHSDEYAAYVELGTVNMGARPSLIPAFEKAKARLLKAWGQLFQ